MPSEQIMSSLIINKVDKASTFESMKEANLVNESELYLIEEQDLLPSEVDTTPTEGSSNLITSGGVKSYVDNQIGNIPTPDVSGQISAHNEDETAHPSIRAAIPTKASDIGAVATSSLGTANGVATLGPDGKVVSSQLPEIQTSAFTISGSAPANTSIFWIDSANSNALKFYKRHHDL